MQKGCRNHGRLIGIDRDNEAIKASKDRLKNFENITYVKENHDNIKKVLQELNIDKVDGILLDLGVSSYQLDEVARGFSYVKDSYLDMRMDKEQKLTAHYIINKYSEENLIKIFFEYGEERFSKRIARAICEYRNKKSIDTTLELAQIIKKVVPFSKKEINSHPAKRVFQAIRIEVNNELEPLNNTVKDSIEMLKSEGRLCIITFHSLEDRIVKKVYNESLGKCTCPKDLPKCVCNNIALGRLVNKKPIIPTEEEIIENSRAKSAKLRVFEKI